MSRHASLAGCAAAPPQPRNADCRAAAARPPRARCCASALRLIVLAALAALATGAGKAHRGKHTAASRRDRREAFSNSLEAATGGMCHFMEETPFVEYFNSELNETRWDGESMDGLFHCHKGTAAFCTMATRSNFQMQQTLPFYPSSENVSGAVLLLSQDPCNNPYERNACCQASRKTFGGYACANWTGAHLVSRGCILYGRLTVEMAMKMPRGTQAFWDAGTYIYGGSPDPTWNELDMIFRTQLVSAASVNASAPANATFVSNTFDAAFFNPIEHKQTFSYSSFPRFTGYMAREYHNYSILWAPHYITWSMDDTVYLNQTRRNGFHRRFGVHGETLIPWRPMTIRLILHTADGTMEPQPDVHIYVRRVAYEPLPAADYGITLLQRMYQLFQDACLVALVVSLCYVCLACCGDGSLVPTLGSGDDDRRTRGAGKFRGDHEDSLQAAGVDMEAFARRAEARARIAAERKAELAAEQAQMDEDARAEREPLLKAQQQRPRQRDDAPAFGRVPISTKGVAREAAAADRAAAAAGRETGGGDESPRQAWRAPPPEPEWRSAPQPPPQAEVMRPQPPPAPPMQPLHAHVAPREPVPYAAEGTDSPRSPQSPPSPGSPSRPARGVGFGRAPPLAERAPVVMQPVMAAAAPAPSRPRPAVVAPTPEPVAPSYPPAPTRPRAQMPPGGWAQPPRPKPPADTGAAGGRPVSPAPHAAAGMPQGRRARPRPQYAEASPPRPPGGDGL